LFVAATAPCLTTPVNSAGVGPPGTKNVASSFVAGLFPFPTRFGGVVSSDTVVQSNAAGHLMATVSCPAFGISICTSFASAPSVNAAGVPLSSIGTTCWADADEGAALVAAASSTASAARRDDRPVSLAAVLHVKP